MKLQYNNVDIVPNIIWIWEVRNIRLVQWSNKFSSNDTAYTFLSSVTKIIIIRYSVNWFVMFTSRQLRIIRFYLTLKFCVVRTFWRCGKGNIDIKKILVSKQNMLLVLPYTLTNNFIWAYRISKKNILMHFIPILITV